MYISGVILDFATRLHQLPTSTVDINSFVVEGNGYWSSIDANLQNKWETEARRWNWTLNADPTQLLNQVFNVHVNTNILDEAGGTILDESGGPIS